MAFHFFFVTSKMLHYFVYNHEENLNKNILRNVVQPSVVFLPNETSEGWYQPDSTLQYRNFNYVSFIQICLRIDELLIIAHLSGQRFCHLIIQNMVEGEFNNVET